MKKGRLTFVNRPFFCPPHAMREPLPPPKAGTPKARAVGPAFFPRDPNGRTRGNFGGFLSRTARGGLWGQLVRLDF